MWRLTSGAVFRALLRRTTPGHVPRGVFRALVRRDTYPVSYSVPCCDGPHKKFDIINASHRGR